MECGHLTNSVTEIAEPHLIRRKSVSGLLISSASDATKLFFFFQFSHIFWIVSECNTLLSICNHPTSLSLQHSARPNPLSQPLQLSVISATRTDGEDVCRGEKPVSRDLVYHLTFSRLQSSTGVDAGWRRLV